MKTITPRAHQLELARISPTVPRFAVFWEMRVGKTYAMLMVQKAVPMPTLITCPLTVMDDAWVASCVDMGVPHVLYYGNARKRGKLRDEIRNRWSEGLVVITNFDTFRSEADKIHEVLRTRRLIVDESVFISNRDAKLTKGVIAFGDQMDSVYILSGKPAPRSPDQYWAQMRCVSSAPDGPAGTPGSWAKPDFWKWAGYWLVPSKKKMNLPKRNSYGGVVKNPATGKPVMEQREVIVGYTINPDRANAWTAMMQKWSWPLGRDQCIDVPIEDPVVVMVNLSPAEIKAYQEAKRKVVTVDDQQIMIDGAARAMKLRQITGGNIYAGDQVLVVGRAKMKALLEQLDLIGDDEPVIVWTQFKAEALQVHEELVKAGRRPVIADGDHNSRSAVAAFRSGEADIIIGHPASIGTGVTLNKCGDKIVRYDIWYSLGWSSGSYDQGLSRNFSDRSVVDKIVHIHLIARGTCDVQIYHGVRNQLDAAQIILNIIKSARAEA